MPWGFVYGYLLGTHWENNVLSIDLTPPTHTTHTYTHIFGASFSVTWGGYKVQSVCVLLQRAFTNDKPVCSLHLRLFDFSFNVSMKLNLPNKVFTLYGFAVKLRLTLTSSMFTLSYAFRLRPNTHVKCVRVELRLLRT